MERIKRKIKFVGELREIIGDEAEVAISDYRDLVSWMQNCYPDSRRILRADNTISIGVMEAGKVVQWIDESYVQHGYIPECECLVVIADVQGAGLEIAAWMLSMSMSAAAASSTALLLAGVINIGISMAINAVIASLADKPDTNKQNEEQSYMLNGASNNNRAGCAVPLLFGRWRASTVVISQSVTSERVTITHPDEIYLPWGNTGNLLANDNYTVGAELDSIDYNGTNYPVPCTINFATASTGISFARNGGWTSNVVGTIGVWNMGYNVAAVTASGFTVYSTSALKITNPDPGAGYVYNSSGIALDDHP